MRRANQSDYGHAQKNLCLFVSLADRARLDGIVADRGRRGDVDPTNNVSERAEAALRLGTAVFGDLPQLCGAHDYAESAIARFETNLVINSLVQ